MKSLVAFWKKFPALFTTVVAGFPLDTKAVFTVGVNALDTANAVARQAAATAYLRLDKGAMVSIFLVL